MLAHNVITCMVSMLACRTEILDCHKLKPEHFNTPEEAFKAADVMVAALKENWPAVEEKHPDILVPGVPLLDQFYYFYNEGTMASLRNSHTPIETTHAYAYIYIMRASLCEGLSPPLVRDSLYQGGFHTT